ncbi:3'-5' DNA helicase [Tulasnella sp. 427]|nr:3'-5' DNA helicase [Tulasnella sp. 427]
MSLSDFEFDEMPSAFLEEVDHIAETQMQSGGGSYSTTSDNGSRAAMKSDVIMVISDDEEIVVQHSTRSTTPKAFVRPVNSTIAKQPTSSNSASSSSFSKSSTSSSAKAVDSADISIDFDDDWDDAIEAEFRQLESNHFKPPTVTRQTTLTGEILSNESQAGPSRLAATQSGRNASKTKVWDRTQYAATGRRKSVGKGKRKSLGYDDEEPEGETMEFEQFPAPFVTREFPVEHYRKRILTSMCSQLGEIDLRNPDILLLLTNTSLHGNFVRPVPAMKLQADPETAQEWIYPLNHPKRDYQYNIVRHCLFENSLVALPTGLGKTFIAGVIMLNYYRWFPKGKVLFMAPTKPLVAQQIEACHHTCGIARSDTVEMTGEVPSAKRKGYWQHKRVFFMTPQTLQNDLKTGICDVMDVVLLVIGMFLFHEAHKATGGYAYSEVVRFLMAKNPHFRVLALSATPGGKVESVQAVVDSLHISHIEIRNEDSLDLRQYLHKKDVVHTVVPIDGSLSKVTGLLAAAMEPLAEKLGKAGIATIHDVIRLHPYRCRSLMGHPNVRSQQWAYPTLAKLEKLARAMGYLMEQSVSMCYKSLTGAIDPSEEDDLPTKSSGAKGRKALKVDNDPAVKKVVIEIDAQRKNRNNVFPTHPKIHRLLEISLKHFKTTTEAETTRVMVFCSFRDCVEEIVDVLNGHSPTLRATRFVGQGIDSSGKKGIAQKEQIELVRQFKQGVFNILVATSIGEEGLDIGEVDLIICYDSQKTPIRMLQRMGRTGRKRNGRIEILSSAGREDGNYRKAGESYKEIQDAITRGDGLELYADVERLLPAEYKPKCVEKVMEIEEFVREEPTEVKEKGRKRKTAADEEGTMKKKRKSAGGSLAMEIPKGAAQGFVPVNELIVRGAKGKSKATKTSPTKSKARMDEYDPDMLAPSDDDDEDLPDLPPPRSWNQNEEVSSSKSSSSQTAGFTPAKALMGKRLDSDQDRYDLPSSKKKPKSKATKTSGPKKVGFSSAAAKDLGGDKGMVSDDAMDSDDLPSLRKAESTTGAASKMKSASVATASRGKGKAPPSSPLSELNITKLPSSKSKPKVAPPPSPIIIPSSPEPASEPPKGRTGSVKPRAPTGSTEDSGKPDGSSGGTDKSMSWLLSDDEDDGSSSHSLRKPVAPRFKPSRPNPPSPTIPLNPKLNVGLSRSAGPAAFKVPFAVPRPRPWSTSSETQAGPSSSSRLDGMDEVSFEIDVPGIPTSTVAGEEGTGAEVDDEAPGTDDLDVDSSFDVRPPGFKRPREPLEPRIELSSPDVSMSYPVRGPGTTGRLRRGRSRAVPGSDDHEEVPSSPGHITIGDTTMESPASAVADVSPPARRPRRQKEKRFRSKIGHAMFEMEAGHSGDEVSEGSTCSEGEYETSFVTYGPATQAPEGYDQAAMYRRGLMTQAGPGGPAFAKRPVRYGQFTGGNGRRGGRVSDMSSEVGEYELGSFVVEDDDEEMLDVSMDSER